MPPALPSHPVLTTDATRTLEQALFEGDEAKTWAAMVRAGQAVARAVAQDAREMGGFADEAKFLVLAGKGHNAGDALIAAAALLRARPQASAEVVFALGERTLQPLAARAWRDLAEAAPHRVRCVPRPGSGPYDLCLDGVFGFQFRPPLPAAVARLLAAVNALPVGLRAAVDLPSGLDEADAFRADFTYATGVVKAPVLGCQHAGRLRYLDLGFFDGTEAGNDRILLPAVLKPLAALRPAGADKRSQGHILIVAGSRGFPGAALMAVLAAVHSGVGLVTAFVPESLVPAFAAQAPEAMWVGWPETPEGGLALEGQNLLQARVDRGTALMMGPGLGREAETQALLADIVRTAKLPLVLDADALQPKVVRAGAARRILTPHAGEFKRIAEGQSLPDLALAAHGVVILKGPITQVTEGGAVYHSLAGGPVLARGGSGDVLAGLTGGLLAQTPADPLLAAGRAVAWHGRAADCLAQAHGQTAVRTFQLHEYFAPALRQG